VVQCWRWRWWTGGTVQLTAGSFGPCLSHVLSHPLSGGLIMGGSAVEGHIARKPLKNRGSWLGMEHVLYLSV
jgi:hypothetical protein